MICITPKQKAKELLRIFPNWQLAMRVVQEIILSRNEDSSFDDREFAKSSDYHTPHPMYYSYWKEVQQEILFSKTTSNLIYFQPPGINEKYCEVGTFLEHDPEYIYFLEEPCKILLSEVNIIDQANVVFDKKLGVYMVKNATKQEQIVTSYRDGTIEVESFNQSNSPEIPESSKQQDQ
jgi:hypothetical protein